MDKKIIFIGDSWVTNFFNVNSFWGEESPIRDFWNNEGFTPYFLGSPSRDTQSILDIWTKHIPHLTPDDLLVVFLPVFNRTRLPLKDKRALYVGHGITKAETFVKMIELAQETVQSQLTSKIQKAMSRFIASQAETANQS